MSSAYGVWPWGECEHEIRGTARKWCGCGEWCSDPAVEAREMMRRADAYWMLCRCCREPLYLLRIAELEVEIAKFHKCDGFEVFLAPDGENGLRECRKPHYHKEDD